jgi:DNA-binding SARP family transcriptional activator
MADIFARALEFGIEPEYAKRVIQLRKLGPPPGHLGMEAWPWPVRIYTLGRFEILIDGKPLQLPARAPRKPLELLKALIAFGSRGVAIGSLVGQIWQDQEGDAARNSLNVALHRLRKILGDDEVISLYEGKLSLDRTRVWVDAWAFQRLTGSIEDRAHGTYKSERHDAGTVAAQLLRAYLGHFLAEEEASWVLGYRERLRSKFLRAIKTLTKRFEEAHRYDEALELHRRAIEIDPLAEEFHCGLMRTLLALGRFAEGIDAYRRCRELLSVTLAIEPSAETQAVYKSLKC